VEIDRGYIYTTPARKTCDHVSAAQAKTFLVDTDLTAIAQDQVTEKNANLPYCRRLSVQIKFHFIDIVLWTGQND